MAYIKQEETDFLDDWSENVTSDVDTSVKQEDVAHNEDNSSANSDAVDTQGKDDSVADNSSLFEQALAWEDDMQQLEKIFQRMREQFQCLFPDDLDDNQDMFPPARPDLDKGDLQDACCHFLEKKHLPQLHRARANLMMVWCIDTETESAIYEAAAVSIVDELEDKNFEMFGLTDPRLEELKQDLAAAHDEILRRTELAHTEWDDEDSDEEESEEE